MKGPASRFGWPLALACIVPICLTSVAFGQRLDPVQWTLTSDAASVQAGASVPLHLKATVQPGWHLYSLTTPKGGPIPTTAGLTQHPAVASVRFFQPPPVRKFDPNFKIDTETFEKDVDFALVAMRRALGLPAEAPFALFAAARTAGWLAHAIEQVEMGALIRPRARYIGPAPED